MGKAGFCPITQKEIPLTELVNTRGFRDNIKALIKNHILYEKLKMA